MNGFKKLYAISAVVVVALGIALAGAFIVGIWTSFENVLVVKCLGTLVVLFLLSIVLHGLAKGMCEEPKNKG